MPSRIEDYALIGDCETAALVSRDGSIDWLCWPRFDSGACFAALLGTPDHGRWRIAPQGGIRATRRRYLPGTLVLETVFETDTGTVSLTDLMPSRLPGTPSTREDTSDLVRIVRGLSGTVAMRMDLTLRFDYGASVPWVSRVTEETGAVSDGPCEMPGCVLRAIAGPDMVVLRTPAQVRGENLSTVAEFSVTAGEAMPFVLTHSPSHRPLPASIDAIEAQSDTEPRWRAWSGRCHGAGEWTEAVERSLITLKALTYHPTGGLVAAPTTSLPEQPGGVRNWDYRYCWLRDATLTLLALMNAGYYNEARAWRAWLERAVAGSPAQIQIMYGIAGERRLGEWTVPWLPGYEGAQPVRIGNAAAVQLQLDVYGELMDALYLARKGGLHGDEASWRLQVALMAHLETAWQTPDEGIWEVRGPPRHFTHSKVMAWVAFDRAVKTIEQFSLDGPLARWRTTRDRIHEEVCRHGYSAERGCFVQSYGSREMDAALLMLPLVGFLPASDPRIQRTVRAIEDDLLVDGLVRRYRTEAVTDGLPAGEGAFLACSFWYVDNLALQGRQDEARALFTKLLALRNDVGLLAEEYDPGSGRMLGNFPQAFSHIALVNSALALCAAADHVGQRTGT
ncbi:glycoside hydrolase family 15 protein [Ralstonia syzygii]|uniref:Glycoside hydrolase family 15 protein n=1 Tax=Ralstonia syzygii TaxID=28097 RepID=A0ABX7ZF69_9RALS|nr:glycoside hydrolase family 15 protein [Ralstonia syzygii]QUP53918.1 glycoside hydrolase family 15 protein [Ralstonia syzygii]